MLVGSLGAKAYSCCTALDNYRLPRAIVHVENRSFVAWNKAFLSLGAAEKQLKAKHAPEADELAKVTRLIGKVIEKIVTSLEPAKSAKG
jgi:hypothetical protein